MTEEEHLRLDILDVAEVYGIYAAGPYACIKKTSVFIEVFETPKECEDYCEKWNEKHGC